MDNRRANLGARRPLNFPSDGYSGEFACGVPYLFC